MADKYDESTDIMAEQPKKFSLLGHSKKSKIINIGSLVLLAIVIVWCVIYQMGL